MIWFMGCSALPQRFEEPPSMAREFIPMEELSDINPDPAIFEVNLRAEEREHRIEHNEDVYLFDGFSYNGLMPGPLIHVEKGTQLKVNFENSLPDPTTIHWHGLHTLASMDGVPWILGPIPAGDNFVYEHTINQSGVFWYHPHFDTEHQVDLGLYGMLLVSDPLLPKAQTELGLMIDDWPIAMEHESHSAFYQEGIWTVNGISNPEIPISGSTLLHIANTSNHHYLDLAVDGGRWVQNDQGILSAPKDRMVLAPGDRGSLLIERDVGDVAVLRYPFSAHGGASLGEPEPIFWLSNTEKSEALEWPFPHDPPTEDVGHTNLVYVFQGDPYSDTWLINGEIFPNISIQTLQLGSSAVIELRNLSSVHHPFHLHGLIFEVLSIDGVPPATRQIEDTIDMGIYQTIRILVHADNPGDWMMHCHILPHGDAGMMTVLRVE